MSLFSTKSLSALTLATLAALSLSACMGAEEKLRRGLINAGLSDGLASCMARPMAQDLSPGQLMKLNTLSKAKNMDLEKTSMDEFMRRTRALQDPEILRITTRAATSCFIQRL